ALQADHVLVEHTVVANHLLVEIAQEGKRQVLILLKRLQREKRINTDTVHLCVREVQRREPVAEGAELLGAYRTERRRKKCEHHRTAAPPAERDRLAVLVGQGEVRGCRTDVYRHESVLRAGPG